MRPRILAVDRAYTPDRWVDAQTAINLISRGAVQSSFGETALVLRGGTNAVTGKQSILEVGSILVIDTKNFLVRDFHHAPFERSLLFKRDKCMCAYCGQTFPENQLEVEHVIPESRGGTWDWTNVVSADRFCNQKKGARTPEEAGMPLLYLPYRPSRFEHLILQNRNILADQLEFLRARVPKGSRLHD